MKNIIIYAVLVILAISISYSSYKVVSVLGESLVTATPLAIDNVVNEVNEIEINDTAIDNIRDYIDYQFEVVE